MTGALLTIVARLVVGIAALALPGWLLSRRIESGARPLAAFLGSAVILFNVILLLTVLRLPLHLGTVGAGLAAISLLLAWKGPAGPGGPTEAASRAHGRHALVWLWWVPIGFGLASIGLRALIDPLSGFDNIFRWDHLARLMIAHQSLASYPPVTAADFLRYGWCDGIPPLVPFLNFWVYAAAGSTAPALTAVRVVGEALLIGGVVARFSRELWGPRAAAVAVAVLASSALFLWSVAMGQETGLVTLSFVALLYFLFRYRSPSDWPMIFWAALAAAVGGLTREYGLSFVLLGAALLGWRKAPARQVAMFIMVATVLTAPWYVRNWILTGNPVYPQALGGIFPTNPVHAEFMRGIAQQSGFATSPYSKLRLAQALVVSTGLVFVLAIPGLVWARRRGVPLWAGGLLIAALWWWSVPQTAGGWVYSTRLLGPAIALGAVLSGWMGQASRRVQLLLAMVVVAVSADAARRAWSLPVRPLVPAWPWGFSDWAQTRRQMDTMAERAVWPILVREAGARDIVVDHTLYHPLVWAAGGRPVPLMSPVLTPTLEAGRSFADVVGGLVAANIRFIVVERASPGLRGFGAAHPFWNQLLAHPPTAAAGALWVYDLPALQKTLVAGERS